MATKSIVLLQPVSVPGAGAGRSYMAAKDRWTDPLHRIGSPPGTAQVRAGKSDHKRIAIVDDEDDLVAIYALMVERWGHRVEFTGRDGTDIVQAFDLKTIQPDIVLLDYRMRVMNGLEAAKKIRSADPRVRIVLVSADDSIRADATATGFVFLQKPFSSSELRDLLDGL